MVKLAIYRPSIEDMNEFAGAQGEVKLAPNDAVREETVNEEAGDFIGFISAGMQALKRNSQHNEMILKRARLIARNRQCPSCRSVKITLWDDAIKVPENTSNTLDILFHCDCCHTSWRNSCGFHG